MTHTPGPWKRRGWLIVNPQNDGLILDGRMKRPKSLFESFVWDSARSTDEQTANIILANTAPELFEACHKALDGMYNQYPQYETMSCEALQHPDMDCYAVEVILDIRAAIAKAEPPQRGRR